MRQFGCVGVCVLAMSGSALADGFIAMDAFSGSETVITFNNTEMGSLASPTAEIGHGVLVTNSGGGGGGPGWYPNYDWGFFFTNIPGSSQGRALADQFGASNLLYDFTAVGNPTRIGMLLSTGIETRWTIEIYDGSNHLIDTGSVVNLEDGQAVFLGYESLNGIGFVRIQDIENGFITVMDDVRYEGVGGGYHLRIGGTCPGIINVDWSGATPGRQQGIVYGANQGSTTIPNGACQGTILGVQGQLRLVNTIGTGSGSGSVNGNAGTAACGHFLQLVEGGTCSKSNVDNIP